MINHRLFFSSFVSAFALCFLIAGSSYPLDAQARDQAKKFSISEAMKTATAKSFEGVDFYFGDQKYPQVERYIGKYSSKKATNAFGKSDWESCEWAFLSAVKSFYERALRQGGNAVVNLISTTRGDKFSSQEEYICRAGNVISKVFLSGEVVQLK